VEKAISSKYHGMELKDDLILSLCLLRRLGTFMGEKKRDPQGEAWVKSHAS